MKVLFYQGAPAPLRKALAGQAVVTAHEKDWSQLSNGDLITAAEESRFEVFVTTDKNLRYQQNLTGRRLAIIVLHTTSWPRIQRHLLEVIAAVDQAQTGSYREISVPSV